ncbi:hypothetical protein MIND_00260100 [Mycena indigotica]|uniref:Uncharacterized protein n=1 Tax=Mycena indigotica TaxID=2126181 RepID=A0A8H6T7R4_9AGAR|nr:uncharacterized protein MIND_00260100 [Mycena indigotica]KAF7312465.1 hypothetical protein MIND_00260100 [Mycena indigotica]
MASPSSSATTPSPVPQAPLSGTVVLSPLSSQSTEPDQRKRAIEKFKARAEISNVSIRDASWLIPPYPRDNRRCLLNRAFSATPFFLHPLLTDYTMLTVAQITRSLRTRLSYASYKATHNIAHMPLRDLEVQSQSQIQVYARTMAAKRKASASAASYPGQSPGGNNYYNNPATQGSASGSMPLRRPGSTSGQIVAPPSAAKYYPTTAGGSGTDSTRPQTLFTSILAPPPAQQARTILNANDPPLTASSRPPASPRTRQSKVASRSIAEGTRASHKSRTDEKLEKRKAKRSLDKGKQKQRRVNEVDADGDVDMKAAATLTSLLLNSRPSIGSASSPRSSLDESDNGSAQSYSHFAQSSARHVGSNASQPSASTVPDVHRASATPPPQTGTPRAGPSDNEAADLMLFLATSPSPVRKGDQRDLAAYRALNGSRPKGRVLFPTAGSMADADGAPKTLSRGMDSFTSSVSSIGGEMRGTTPGNSRTSTPVPTTAIAVAPVPRAVVPTPAQLLPPPTMPPVRQESPKLPQQQEFNYNEYLHPSPVPAAPQRTGSASITQKQNLGLRADVGRKLFEEEQMRHHAMTMNQSSGKPRVDDRTLGAGIDLIQSSS